MKKILSFLAAMTMCVCLVACGGPDRQPAIDSYNRLVDNYNAFVEYVNADLDSFTQEEIDELNSIVEAIDLYGEKLESEEELTQEELDQMIKVLDDFNEVVEEVLAEIEG